MAGIGDWLLSRSEAGALADVAVQALHLCTGILLARFHGWHKLADGLAWRNGRSAHWPFADEVRAAGFPLPVANAWLATAVQLVGGILLALGLLTRPAALMLIATLTGAVYTNIALRKESQMALVYLLLLAGVAALGAGRWSLDAWLFR